MCPISTFSLFVYKNAGMCVRGNVISCVELQLLDTELQALVLFVEHCTTITAASQL